MLIRTFLDLAREHGRPPTTSEIATEAGVAEGTIYRAFPTKEALRDEALASAFCPAPIRHRLMQIDPDQPLRDRLVEFARIMQQRFTDVFGLMAALGLTQPPNRGAHLACYQAGRHLQGVLEDGSACDHAAEHQPLFDAIHELVDRDADDLVVPARDVVHRIRLLTFSGSHPGIADGLTLSPEQIVDTVLYGVVARAPQLGSGLSITELYAELGGDAAALRRISQLDGSQESLTPPEPNRAGQRDQAQRHT